MLEIVEVVRVLRGSQGVPSAVTSDVLATFAGIRGAQRARRRVMSEEININRVRFTGDVLAPSQTERENLTGVLGLSLRQYPGMNC